VKQRERRGLKVALWAGVIGEIMGVGAFVLNLRQNLNDFQAAYLQTGVAGLLGDFMGLFVGLFIAGPIFIAVICGGFVWLWSLLFIKSN
jgi:hypothetical protein